jgi:hypothetical protein
MHKSIIAAAAAVMLAGCSEEAPVENPQEDAAALAPGQYQATWKVSALRSMDRSTPLTNLKANATGTTTACVSADGTVDPALFAEDGDTCTVSQPYVRNGRMSLSLACTRKGQAGEVRQSVTGTFKADSLEAEVGTTTYLSGVGDYAMTRTFSARRIAECPPAALTPEKTAAVTPEKKV